MAGACTSRYIIEKKRERRQFRPPRLFETNNNYFYCFQLATIKAVMFAYSTQAAAASPSV